MARYKKGWSKEHQEIFKLHLSGMVPKDIASRLGTTPMRVYSLMRADKFQKKEGIIIEKATEKARQLLESRLVEAAQKVVKIMKSGKAEQKIQFDAAKEILYQCGLKPVEVVETRTRQYTPEEAASALAVVKEIQTIEETLSRAGSNFIVEKSDEESYPVPVKAGTADVVSVDTSELVSDQSQTPVEELQGAGLPTL